MLKKYLNLPNNKDIRAARSYLDWSQGRMANKVGLNLSSITKIEKGKQHPTKEHLEKIAEVFFEEGIKFHKDGGFEINNNIITIYEGTTGYQKVLEDALITCTTNKGEILFLGNDDKRSNKEINEIHKRMYEVKIQHKLLVPEDNDYALGPIKEYRQISKDFFLSKDVITIYGNKIAFFAEEEGDLENYKLTKVQIIVIESAGMAEQYRAYFYRLWNKATPLTKSSAKQIFF